MVKMFEIVLKFWYGFWTSLYDIKLFEIPFELSEFLTKISRTVSQFLNSNHFKYYQLFDIVFPNFE